MDPVVSFPYGIRNQINVVNTLYKNQNKHRQKGFSSLHPKLRTKRLSIMQKKKILQTSTDVQNPNIHTSFNTA